MDAHTIALVKERADIAQIIAEHVQLRPSGQGYKGLCPFHQEKTPSFTVNVQRGFFHCFGCGKGGSVVDFVMARQGMEFGEALAWLAERVGVELKPGQGGIRCVQALKLATEFYHQQLMHAAQGESFRAYLRSRGFEEADWSSFQLGAALNDWQGLIHQLQSKIDIETLLKAGLVGKGKSGRAYDWMRGRVVFPIQDASGHTLGLGGRLLEDGPGQSKYLNTPETVYYRKHRVLFGLPQALAAWRASKCALLVEGYLDVLRMHQHGFSQAVAACGTSLTGDHVALLKRHNQEVILLFDGDSAGMRAVMRSVPLFLEHNLEARVALLPKGLDPDDLLVQQGTQALQNCLDDAKPLLEHLAFATLQQFPASVQGKQQALAALADNLQAAKTATRAVAIRHLADLLGIDPASVLSQLAASTSPKRTLTAASRTSSSAFSSASSSASSPAISHREKRILALLAWHPSLADIARTLFQPGDFSSDLARNLFGQLTSSAASPQIPSSPQQAASSQEATLLRSLQAEKPLHVHAAKDPKAALQAETYYLKRPRLLELRRAWQQALNTPQEELAQQRWRKAQQALQILKPPRYTYQPREEMRLKSPDQAISSLAASSPAPPHPPADQ